MYEGGFFVKGKAEGKTVDWLVDTGCTTTIISTRVFDHLDPEERPDLTPYPGCLMSADESPIQVRGKTLLNIQLGQTLVQHSVIVAEVMNDGLLGLDFLQQHKMVINFATSQILCDGEKVVAHCRAGTDRVCRVVAAETASIPARTRTVMSAKSSRPLVSGTWLVEPLNRTPGGQSVLLAKTLSSGCGDRVNVELINPTDEDINIYKYTSLGIVTRIQQPDVLCSVSHTPEETFRQSTTPEPPKQALAPELVKILDDVDKDLTEEETASVKELLSARRSVFGTKELPFGQTTLVQHDIVTTQPRPIKQPVRRPPFHLKEEAELEVKKMLDLGVIEPSNSPWASPVVLVRKKDGSLRYCIDYRRLNTVTQKDSYPLPRIDDSLDSLGRAKYFSTLDLASGYWQIGLSEDAKQKSAFCTTGGLYQFKVMPFGLTNAPATFQRLMERVLGGLQWQICLVYIDDIIIFSRTFEQHLESLDQVFERLEWAGLKLKPKKCHLFRKKVKYLGHEVSAEGIATDPEKTKAVREWPVPKTVAEVRSFLGLCSYYRRFVEEFATTAKPLTKLTEKSVPFVWKEAEQAAFDKLKHLLCTAPVLAFPDRDATFVLDTDASDVGIGAVLSQLVDGEERVIAYGSRVLTKQERRYCITRRELLAVVHFVKTYRHFLVGKEFKLRTDHASLRWIKSFKEPEGQLARWLETLDTYNMTLEHRPGKKHINADALSRGPCMQCSMDHEGVRIHSGRKSRADLAAPVRTRGPPSTGAGGQPGNLTLPNWLADTKLSPAELKQAQMADPDLSELYKWVQDGERPDFEKISHHGSILKFYWGQYRSLKIVEGILIRELDLPDLTIRRQFLIPPSLTKEVLLNCHDALTAGHFGQTKTLANVTRRFLWPGMRREVNLYVKSCDICARYKTHGKKGRAELKDYRVGVPMERVCIDIAGAFPVSKSGNKYALIVTDWFTKYVEIYPMPNQEAATVAKTITREFFSRYGVPNSLHSDQGRNFEGHVFAEMCSLLGIQKTRTTPFRPQSDGQSERNIKTLIKMVAMTAEHQTEWDEHLPFLSMAYRSTPHEGSGLTPNFMMYGRELAMPVDVMLGPSPQQALSTLEYVKKLRDRLTYAYKLARETLRRSAERQKKLYDRKKTGTTYHVGDAVWYMAKNRKVGVSPKLQPKWLGPCVIVRMYSDVIAEIQLTARRTCTVHVDLLKPSFAAKQPRWVSKLIKKLSTLPGPT